MTVQTQVGTAASVPVAIDLPAGPTGAAIAHDGHTSTVKLDDAEPKRGVAYVIAVHTQVGTLAAPVGHAVGCEREADRHRRREQGPRRVAIPVQRGGRSLTATAARWTMPSFASIRVT